MYDRVTQSAGSVTVLADVPIFVQLEEGRPSE